MLWFSVWAVLVVGTLVGAWFLLRSLWRSARALMDELGRASQVLAELADKAEELRRVSDGQAEPIVPTPFADKAELQARLAHLREAREARKDARWERDEATRERWRAVWR